MGSLYYDLSKWAGLALVQAGLGFIFLPSFVGRVEKMTQIRSGSVFTIYPLKFMAFLCLRDVNRNRPTQTYRYHLQFVSNWKKGKTKIEWIRHFCFPSKFQTKRTAPIFRYDLLKVSFSCKVGQFSQWLLSRYIKLRSLKRQIRPITPLISVKECYILISLYCHM